MSSSRISRRRVWRCARRAPTTRRRAEAQAARVWLAARLAAKADAEPESEVRRRLGPAPLKNATLALLAAARNIDALRRGPRLSCRNLTLGSHANWPELTNI